MSPNPEWPTTSVLLIDGFAADRIYFSDQLKRCSFDYQILEATDGQSGLDVYRSRRVDCVVLELALPDRSGFEVLENLVSTVGRPQVAVIALTHLIHHGVWELAKQDGAIACFVKRHMASDDLDRAIQHSIALVGLLPKEDRYRPI
jgi:CheY-like chemotaxis protein